MRDIVDGFISHSLSRRQFVQSLAAIGVSAAGIVFPGTETQLEFPVLIHSFTTCAAMEPSMRWALVPRGGLAYAPTDSRTPMRAFP